MSMIAASRTVARACLRTSSAAALSTATEGAALHKDAKLLVCDMAGTTVMEEGLVYSTLLDCMIEKGLGVTEAEMHPWHGADKTEVTANFVQREIADEAQRLAMAADIDALFLVKLEERYLAPDSPVALISPDLPDFLANLRASGVKVGLNTGYPTRLQEALLEKLELKSMVDAWCCAADVTRARPSPFMVFNLMNQCNVETGVVKVGDTVRDMGEGIAAHAVQNVGVLSGADDAATLFDAGADVVIPDVTKLSLELLAEAPAAAAAA